GSYQTEAGQTVTASFGWDEDDLWFLLGLLFPPFWLGMCPARGRPRRRVQKPEVDTNQPGGTEAKPLPSGTAVQPGHTTSFRAVSGGSLPQIAVVYVDTNQQDLRDYWSYRGSWGAAELEQYPFGYEGAEAKQVVVSSGQYGGAWRPNLAAWFLWNLCFDPVHGAGAGYYLLPTP
ncbi:MAG TPA: hypothetical protein VF163_15390, partial [Micromonosporaceae bacterium]